VTSSERRRELRATYEQRPSEAGVYALRNAATGRVLVASTSNLTAVRNRLDFAQATQTPGALDHRVAADARAFGVEAFVLEVLDTLEVTPAMTRDDVRADLGALEQLWREKLAATPQY
jgi:hypothetical protein